MATMSLACRNRRSKQTPQIKQPVAEKAVAGASVLHTATSIAVCFELQCMAKHIVPKGLTFTQSGINARIHILAAKILRRNRIKRGMLCCTNPMSCTSTTCTTMLGILVHTCCHGPIPYIRLSSSSSMLQQYPATLESHAHAAAQPARRSSGCNMTHFISHRSRKACAMGSRCLSNCRCNTLNTRNTFSRPWPRSKLLSARSQYPPFNTNTNTQSKIYTHTHWKEHTDVKRRSYAMKHYLCTEPCQSYIWSLWHSGCHSTAFTSSQQHLHRVCCTSIRPWANSCCVRCKV